MRVIVAVEDKVYAKAITDLIGSMNWDENPCFNIICSVPALKYRIPVIAGVADTRYVEIQEERRRAAKSLVLSVGSEIVQKIPRAKIEDTVANGDPKAKILALALKWQSDLIVMGAHNNQDVERFFMGSTSMAVLSHAPCSVLIVKIPDNQTKSHH